MCEVQAFFEVLEVVVGDAASDGDLVLLGHLVAGVCEAIGEFAVVCQEYESRRVCVEPAYGVEARGELDQFGDAGSAFGVMCG